MITKTDVTAQDETFNRTRPSNPLQNWAGEAFPTRQVILGWPAAEPGDGWKRTLAEIIRAALSRNGAIVLVPDRFAAARIVNRIAPEHLELAVSAPEDLLGLIRHAGAVFLGCHGAEVLGDYCAGPNHVLPTGRTARFSSPLGVYDFQKRSSLVQCQPEAGAILGKVASVLARAEGLTAHARAAEYRYKGN